MKILSILSVFAALSGLCLTNVMAQTKSGSPYEGQIDAMMSRMSLREKLGQMVELDLRGVMTQDAKGNHVIDTRKLDSILINYKVGSFLNTPGPQGVTAAEWEKYMMQLQKATVKHVGIPLVFGVDENHGMTYTTDGTLMPQNINIAATFNREIAKRGAQVTAYETRACSVPWTYSPTMDLSDAGKTLERTACSMLRWERL